MSEPAMSPRSGRVLRSAGSAEQAQSYTSSSMLDQPKLRRYTHSPEF